METLRIAHGNGRNKTSLVEFVKDTDADSAGLNEAHRLLRPLNRIPDYRMLWARDGWADRRAASSPILTKDEHENLGELVVKMSDALPRWPRFAPDRVMTCAMFDHPVAEEADREGIAHFNLHPDPLLGHGSEPLHPLVQQYGKALRISHRFMRLVQKMGFLVIVTGDLQVSRGFDEDWGPRQMLAESLGLNFRTTGVDWILWDNELEPIRWDTRRLFDHTGLVMDFKAVAA